MASSRPSSSRDSHQASSPTHDEEPEADVPIETLVEHLLSAKRALSTMTSVLRANEICTLALELYEEAVVLGSETEYLRRALSSQLTVLTRVRNKLDRTCEAGKRDFRQLIRMMDGADGKMKETVAALRERTVEAGLREGEGDEGQRNLMDFVDEKSVTGVVEALKESLKELQSIQTSFDGDILRFETEIRSLKKAIAASVTNPSSPSASHQPISSLLFSLTDHSQNMASLLSSLTKHFDLCVTAVRTTEGGAALARRKAAEATAQDGGPSVSISGVIAEQESHVSDLEPITARDRADMIKVVVDDASEVEGVVSEIGERLAAMEDEFAALREQVEGGVRRAYGAGVAAFRALDEVGGKLAIYVAAESEFLARWDGEKAAIFERLEEMEQLREFYEGYANAYERLILEVDRRGAAEDRVRAVWRKARETVERMMSEDAAAREGFMQDVGEFLPTDLWPGMDNGMKRWEVRPVGEGDDVERSTPALSPGAVEGARARLAR
ncbi:related to protein involved in authophagy (APG17) [Cephalotrichum gorgonifer]|uniref:Autophagy-related protein 17 n=1 Tax=Cephalotrichum gorgonifer TaxID=2041049 RepID=A0AAE8MWS2_9PEZI|nr:related to protein involved in authophagy (APG17) [Cephalotrichum gorgonifer]